MPDVLACPYVWTRHATCRVLLKWAGATPRTFWAAESRKSGVAPARFSVFSTLTFAFTGSLSPTAERNCSRHRVKKQVKTKVQCVVLTFFTWTRERERRGGSSCRPLKPRTSTEASKKEKVREHFHQILYLLGNIQARKSEKPPAQKHLFVGRRICEFQSC